MVQEKIFRAHCRETEKEALFQSYNAVFQCVICTTRTDSKLLPLNQ